jgi:hypothetical protein
MFWRQTFGWRGFGRDEAVFWLRLFARVGGCWRDGFKKTGWIAGLAMV